jgi:hypothetical protein
MVIMVLVAADGYAVVDSSCHSKVKAAVFHVSVILSFFMVGRDWRCPSFSFTPMFLKMNLNTCNSNLVSRVIGMEILEGLAHSMTGDN